MREVQYTHFQWIHFYPFTCAKNPKISSFFRILQLMLTFYLSTEHLMKFILILFIRISLNITTSTKLHRLASEKHSTIQTFSVFFFSSYMCIFLKQHPSLTVRIFFAFLFFFPSIENHHIHITELFSQKKQIICTPNRILTLISNAKCPQQNSI